MLTIAKRLQQICDEEGLETDLRALCLLAEMTDGDVRSCLNTLQVSMTSYFFILINIHPISYNNNQVVSRNLLVYTWKKQCIYSRNVRRCWIGS